MRLSDWSSDESHLTKKICKTGVWWLLSYPDFHFLLNFIPTVKIFSNFAKKTKLSVRVLVKSRCPWLGLQRIALTPQNGLIHFRLKYGNVK